MKRKIKWSLLAAISAVTTLVWVASANANLTVTGTFDGPLPGGEPKVVELYVNADIADLSLFGVGGANNGGGTDGVELVLSGAASAGDFIYIVEDDDQGALGVGFNAYFGFTPSLLFDGSFANGGAASINGDDAIEVFSDPSGLFAGAETVIDVFGDINVDGSGQPWDYLDGWAYRNNGTGPDGATFAIGNWSFSGINVNDGETSNASAPTPFPIGSYQVAEPSTVAMIVLSIMGFGILNRRLR